MSSDRLGKYREKPSRSRTPYSRPKGLIRRVTDSVSGLLGGSWIPSFLRGDEQELQAPDNAEQNHQPQPGVSGYKQPQQLSPRSVAVIYPEEAGDVSDVSNIMAAPVAVGSSLRGQHSTPATDANTRHYVGPSTAAILAQDITRNLEGVDVSRIFPESSFRESYRGDVISNDTPQLSTPGHSQYTAATQLVTSGQSQYSQLSTPGPSSHYPAASAQTPQYNASAEYNTPLPGHSLASSIGESSRITMQWTKPSTPNTGEGVSTPSARIGSAQSASKRPRFSVAAYSAAASPVGNKSMLSDGSFRSSPFYPGRTIYGGAGAYRRTPTPVTPNRSATASPRIGSAASNDAGLSDAAQRILSCLNAMSTPLTDAKRIPTPSASPYASYLDSPYTAAFHKHRPNRPPTTALHTPAKVGIQSNLSQYVLPVRPSSTGQSSKIDHSFLDPAPSACITSVPQQPSIFSVAAASAATKSAASSVVASTTGSVVSSKQTSIGNPLLQPSVPIVISDNKAAAFDSRLSVIEEDQCLPAVADTVSPRSSTFSFGGGATTDSCVGKMKSSKMSHSHYGRSSSELPAAMDFAPALDAPIATLPKIVFTAPIELPHTVQSFSAAAHKTAPTTTQTATQSFTFKTSSAEGQKSAPVTTQTSDFFKFSLPEVLEKRSDTTNKIATTSMFMFRAPSSVISEDNTPFNDSNFVVPKSSFVPKVKSASPVNKTNTSNFIESRELISKPGGLLDYLSKSNDKDAGDSIINKSYSSSSKNNSIFSSDVTSKSIVSASGWGDKFKSAPGSWECGACFVRNKSGDSKCISCQTSNPGQTTSAVSDSSASNLTNNKSGFGDVFKKNNTDWDCDTCLLRNKEASDKCIACMTPKAGSKSITGKESSFSFGVKAASLSTTTAMTFGIPGAAVSSSITSATSTSSSFSFGIKPTISTTSKDSSPLPPAVNCKPSTESKAVVNDVGFGETFKKVAGDWECTSCLLNNPGSSSKCVACETAKSGSATKQLINNKQLVKKQDLQSFQGFGNQFKKAAGDWECEVCLVSNKSASAKCISCESAKPGSVDNSKVLTGNYKFGNTNKTSESSFKFGVENSKAKELQSVGNKSLNDIGFKFGANTSKTDESSGFSFGDKTDENPTPSNFSFGAKPVENSTSSNFSFGTTPVETSTPSNFSFGAKPVETSTTSNFSFGVPAANCSNGFGSTASTKDKPSDVASPQPASTVSFLPSINPSPNLKTKPVESAKSIEDIKSGSVLDFLKSSTDNKKNSNESTTFSFGQNPVSKTNDSASKTIPTFPFGQSNATLSKPSFQFGAKSDGNASLNLFQDSNSILPTTKTDPVKTPNNKRSLVDDAESSNKRQNSSFGKNNGIADSKEIAPFSFGKAALNTTASASNMFQFGSSTTKTDATFGSVAPSFGNTSFVTNNNTINSKNAAVPGAAPSMFAFGQPSEKKPSATFEFGQATPPTFNFAATTPPSFQFTKEGNNATSATSSNNGSIFQFGNSAIATPNAVTPSFGSAPSNPFSQTPSVAQSGRVMKRAIRRTKK